MHEKVYLDTCCLNRPFDDQSQARVHREARAIALILQELRDDPKGRWVRSEVLDFEVVRCPDADRRQRMRGLLDVLPAGEVVRINAVRSRADELETLGFRPLDALHLASAEQAKADVLFTTDDRFQRLAARHVGTLRVTVENPFAWLTVRNTLA